MQKNIVLAIDAMGSDHAPAAQLEGAERLLGKRPDVKFLLFGDQAQLQPLLQKLPALQKSAEIRHTDSIVAPNDKPSSALRQGRNSSMGLAIKAVADGEAVGVISAGNTGALMALARLSLKMLPGIDRPAIVTRIPTIKGESVMLDLGANVDCTPEHLFQFAVMGDAFARAVSGLDNPSIGILNIGSEDLKGHMGVKTAADMLRHTTLPLNFYGFIEGDDITSGKVDVIVTDGFTGNVALKTAEGTAHIFRHFLEKAFRSTPLAMLGALLAKPALRKMSKKLDPRRHNGAMFVGLNGIAVKSHGSADALAFYNAIKVAIDLASHQVNDRIISEMQKFRDYSMTAQTASGQNTSDDVVPDTMEANVR